MKAATQQDTWDAIFGSGCTGYSWWRGVAASFDMREDAPEGWSAVVRVDNPDGPGVLEFTVTHKDLMRAARKIASGKTEWPQYQGPGKETVREARNLVFNVDDADLDADSADQVPQVATLGRVIYG
ncbi:MULTISPECIES: hypothetical protein [unclassified Kitasatospora]|uniref:hypothetical protein n=1 Tax=unclassified Kitasatospora TaxID=2633591 RepID=UPI0024732F2C|nr:MULTISPECIES: hypothetical protein [unclassified Kitasatospora]MDH6123829.1 hypothetical protein [Kitasatospora sp. GP82]MDH6576072.1 hypothetical protein [Kitasatospora sp. MAP5-34]